MICAGCRMRGEVCKRLWFPGQRLTRQSLGGGALPWATCALTTLVHQLEVHTHPWGHAASPSPPRPQPVLPGPHASKCSHQGGACAYGTYLPIAVSGASLALKPGNQRLSPSGRCVLAHGAYLPIAVSGASLALKPGNQRLSLTTGVHPSALRVEMCCPFTMLAAVKVTARGGGRVIKCGYVLPIHRTGGGGGNHRQGQGERGHRFGGD